jgi:hypothetical protein
MLRPRLLTLIGSCLLLLLAVTVPLRGDYPVPSPYPIDWELTLTHSLAKRIVVSVPGDANPSAYWYMTYHVVNNSDKDKVLMYPVFDMMMEDGRVIRSDANIPTAVYDAIKRRENIKYLQPADKIAGEIRQGEDQSKDGVAIWPEPALRMGTFVIFASGFWGETAHVKVGDQTVPLHKTLQITYHINGDENHPGQGEVVEQDSTSIMR